MVKLITPKKSIFIFLSAAIIFTFFISFDALNKKKQKILLIGLDGASWKIILPLIKEGKLPNIKRLMDNGCWGKLETITPPFSEIIWTTIATGKTPQIHGITGNIVEDPDTAEMVPPTSNLRKVKAIWNILSDYKKRVGVIGYKVSWPAEKVNGVMISDRADASKYLSSGYSEPPFADLYGQVIFNSFGDLKDNPAVIVDRDNIYGKDIFMFNCARYLLKTKEFDFFCIYLYGIDILSHRYWRNMFPQTQRTSDENRPEYKDVIKDSYIWCDSVIGELLKNVDKNTTVTVVSDHGFKAREQNGERYIFDKINRLFEIAGLKKLKHNSKLINLKITPPQVWIYKKNIEIAGNLSKDEFSLVRENAKKAIRDIKVEENGRCIFKILNDTQSGFTVEIDTQTIDKPEGFHVLVKGQEYKMLDFMMKDPAYGEHDVNDAVIIISGKNIRRNQKLHSASAYDIVPTVLYMFDLPLAKDMPGKVLKSAIAKSFLYAHRPRHIYTYEKNNKIISDKPIRAPLDEKIIKERMRSLGYIN
jgi:predicted AlkP superfamily phosphohydrolase/phosphomutase